MSRSRRSNFTPEQIKQNQASSRNLLGNFIRNTGGGLVDFVTLGATDLDKKGDTKFQEGAKNFLANVTKPVTDLTKPPRERETLGDSFDQDKYFKSMRNMMVTDSLLRDYELGRDANRQFAMMQKTLPLVDLYAETAAQRRLMEDKSSPTKISQQILRARQGEAALMNAIANQAGQARLIGAQGSAPRGRAGGA